MISTDPPGGNGTIKRTGRFGYVCASVACEQSKVSAATTATANVRHKRRRSRLLLVWCLAMLGGIFSMSRLFARACAVALPDYLVRLYQNGFGDCEPQRTCGLEVDDQLELSRLFDGKVPGLSAPEDFVHIVRRATESDNRIDAIGHQSTKLRRLRVRVE